MSSVLQFFSRIQNRLLIAMITVTAIPLIAVMVQASRQTTEALGEQAEESLQYQARLRSLGLLTLFEFSKRDVEKIVGQERFWAMVTGVPDGDRQAFELFRTELESSQLGRLTYIEHRGTTIDGDPVLEVRRTYPPILEDPSGLKVVAAQTFGAQKTQIGFSQECHGLIVVPVIAKGNTGRGIWVGALIGTISPDTIRSFVAERAELDDGVPAGYMLAQGPGSPEPGATWIQPDENGLGAVLARGRQLAEIIGDEGARRLLDSSRGVISTGERAIGWDSFQIGGFHFIVGVMQDHDVLLLPVAEARRVFLFILGVAVVLSIVLCVVFARQLTKPIEKLRHGAQEIAAGHLDHRIDVKTGDEIEQLAGEFNRMAQALAASHADLERRIQEKTEELQQANRVLMQTEKLRSLGELAAGVAHEINNPAGIVSMYAEMLLEKPDLDERDRKKLTTILENAERIAAIAGGMLDFSRTHEFRPEPSSVVRPLEKALSLVAIRKIAGDVEIVRDLPDDLPLVRGDENQLIQVFVNLFSNAVQAMGGEGRLSVSARSIGDPPEQVEIRISDTGPGIPPESLDKLFEPFFTTKAPGEGTGLGLSISYGIIRNHGGEIRVEETGPEGTTFRVVLPVSDGLPGIAAASEDAESGEPT